VGLGEYLKAIEYYEKSLSLNLKLYSEGVHPDNAISYRGLSLAYGGVGDRARAEEFAQKANVTEIKLKGQ
ncbi:MAG: tetratricopeptide repeat protein, partial [Pelodictyon phaeoclathratiforme]